LKFSWVHIFLGHPVYTGVIYASEIQIQISHKYRFSC